MESRTEEPDGSVVLVHSRALPDGVPGFLQRFLPKDGRVVQTDTWGPPEADGSRRGTWAATFAGAPGEVLGTTAVLADGAGSTWAVEGTATFRIPLVGGKVESYVAELVERLAVRQAEVLRELVAE